MRLIYILLLCSAVPLYAGMESSFNEGNMAYQAHEYMRALEHYSKALSYGHSVSLHMNTARTFEALQDTGHAVLHYMRASIIEPRNTQLRARLEALYTKEAIPTLQTGKLEQFASLASVHTWNMGATVAFWSFVVSLIVYTLYIRTRLAGYVMSVLLVCTACMFLGLWGWNQSKRDGIVLGHQPLKIAPTSSSPDLVQLQSGERVRIQRIQGDYAWVKSARAQGWLACSDYERIVP